jgi:NAD(P)-dependent dehydrogenase (short-subunit alcohol dehydrogenase family)
MGQLTNKHALITGAASGIGRATAFLFAVEGASISVVDLDIEGGRKVVDEINTKGGKAIFVHCDVRKASDCQDAVQETVEKIGGIEILFNNAGVIRRATVLDTTEAEWDLVMDVNVKSIYLFSKFAIPYIARAGGGSIVNMSSGWGLRGGRKAVSYCAAKGAVINLTRAMALDHAGENIRVNCLCPGDVDTAMLRNEARQLGQSEVDFMLDAADRPLGRIGSPEEIAQAVLYLVSDVSSYITGTALVIDGGGLAG